jgi:hypothetical protein
MGVMERYSRSSSIDRAGRGSLLSSRSLGRTIHRILKWTSVLVEVCVSRSTDLNSERIASQITEKETVRQPTSVSDREHSIAEKILRGRLLSISVHW